MDINQIAEQLAALQDEVAADHREKARILRIQSTPANWREANLHDERAKVAEASAATLRWSKRVVVAQEDDGEP